MGFSQYSISNWKNIKVFLVWNCRQQRRLVPVTYVVHKEHPLRRGHQALCSFISFRAVLRVAGRASMALTTTLIQQWHRVPEEPPSGSCVGAPGQRPQCPLFLYYYKQSLS